MAGFDFCPFFFSLSCMFANNPVRLAISSLHQYYIPHSALAQIAVDKQAIKSSGETGFLLWRSVYLSKQVSLRNRVLVFFDWIKTRAFGRDITRFNTL